MSTYCYAYWEVYEYSEWRLAGDLVRDDEFNLEVVPENIAQVGWGRDSFAKHYEVYGERGIPDNLSKELRFFINRHWESLNRASWMTVEEIKKFYESDIDGQYFHLRLDKFPEKYNQQDKHKRAIFWADQ